MDLLPVSQLATKMVDDVRRRVTYRYQGARDDGCRAYGRRDGIAQVI